MHIYFIHGVKGMLRMQSEIPIELECWMLKNGIMPIEHLPANPDIVWPAGESDHARAVRTGISNGWMPTFVGEEPPF